jgi:hypothetical protein
MQKQFKFLENNCNYHWIYEHICQLIGRNIYIFIIFVLGRHIHLVTRCT